MPLPTITERYILKAIAVGDLSLDPVGRLQPVVPSTVPHVSGWTPRRKFSSGGLCRAGRDQIVPFFSVSHGFYSHSQYHSHFILRRDIMDRSASTNDRVHHVDAAGAIRELLVHMIRASTDGDLALVEALYERYKAIDPLQHNTLEGEEFQSKVESAMDYAAARGHAGILSYFLSQGLPISKGLPNMALLATRYSDKKAIEVFQVLLEHGWDINHCVGSTASPVLSYVSNEILRA